WRVRALLSGLRRIALCSRSSRTTSRRCAKSVSYGRVVPRVVAGSGAPTEVAHGSGWPQSGYPTASRTRKSHFIITASWCWTKSYRGLSRLESVFNAFQTALPLRDPLVLATSELSVRLGSSGRPAGLRSHGRRQLCLTASSVSVLL